MSIELISRSAWTSVLRGTRHVQFEFLALQLFLANLRNRLQANEISIDECIRELEEFYAKFSRLPLAEKDFNKIAEPEQEMTGQLLDVQETARRITAGQSLMLAGEERLLATLPHGNWIGGTIPYFMGAGGGCVCKDKIFVTELPAEFQPSSRLYTTSELPGIYRDAGEGAVTFVILSANSPAHTEFALHAPRYANFALHPLAGWIAGVDLESADKIAPKIFCGGPEPLGDGAAVMRLKLPADRLAQINIINLFQPGNGDTISFPTTGFSATTARINGVEHNLAEYLERIHADTRLPLVADYFGARINVSLKSVDSRNGRVEFFGPVAAGIEYKLANPINDYVSEFEKRLSELSPGHLLFSCNCILNYLYSKLENRRTGALVGPVTFGEIAFQLLNQTLVFIELVKVEPPIANGTESELLAAKRELSAAHEEIEAGERRFRALSESAPMGIFLTDTMGRTIYENSRCQELTGASKDESSPRGDWKLRVHPLDLPGLNAALIECEREGRDFDREYRFVGVDGKARWVHTRTAFLRSETGEITGRIGTVEDISDRKQAEIEMERVSQDLIKASREAGMAELASGVLHNVKNVVNSVNVSIDVIGKQLKQSKSVSLGKVTDLLREHSGDIGAFMTEDPKGKLLPHYLEQLGQQLAREREAVLEELRHLEKSAQHIKEIVTTQQNCAKGFGGSQKIKPVDLMEDSLRIVSAGLARHGVQVIREFDANLPEITVEKHKVLQILVNFIRNAKEACQTSTQPEKKVTLRATNGGEFIHLAVTDNGVGIAPENLANLFHHGFTTKKDGHGFGLHSSARVVTELGGDIQVRSDGPGAGATFSLKLPVCHPSAN